MGLFKIRKRDFYICDSGRPHLKRERVDQFNETVLDLGNLTTPSIEMDAVAAVFDLAGFTRFCTQIDPQLAIPEYLSSFLAWLFREIKEWTLVSGEQADSGESESDDGTVPALVTLPFYSKFMGDGVLFLWDTRNLTEEAICSIPALAMQVSAAYSVDFLPKVSFSVADPPDGLRCGIARGKVYSVGDGRDFVGPCINMAARLQKLSLIPVSFSRRGFDADKHMNAHMRGHFVLKKVSVRGIGENELVYVSKDDFERLPAVEKKSFREPDDEWRMPDDDLRPSPGAT
jgi:class 3 adenylate cyclase